MKQAWCSNPKCDGGAKVGPDCPAAWLVCAFCGSPLTFTKPPAVTHTYLHGAMFECESCGDEYEDHPLAFAPHLCPPCEEYEAEERFAHGGDLEDQLDALLEESTPTRSKDQ